MNVLNLKHVLICISFCLMITYVAQAQSYRKDSLQIKVYTVIDYENDTVKDIKLLKVLCDYCSELQSKAIGDEALRRTYLERYAPENVLSKGQKKLALFIRISKKDFAAIKEEDY